MVEPSCPVQWSSHVVHRVRSGFRSSIHPSHRQTEVPRSLVECHSYENITEFKFLIVIVRCFPSVPPGICSVFVHMKSSPNFQCIDGDPFTCLLTKHRIALSIAAANSGGHRSVAVGPWLVVAFEWFASGRQHVCQLLTVAHPPSPSLVPVVSCLVPRHVPEHTHVASGHNRVFPRTQCSHRFAWVATRLESNI